MYKQDVMSIFRIDSEKELESKLEEISGTWSQATVNYFSKEMKPDILRHSAKFVLVPLDVYDPYSGMTRTLV